MTKSKIRALRILRREGDSMTAREFARKWFKRDDPIWTRVSNVGNGSTRGVGAWRWAGGYLGKLTRLGLVKRGFTDWGQSLYRISEHGGVELAKAEA